MTMAIYHLSVKAGNKGTGKSGGIRYDYITRQESYEKKADQLVYQESGNMPSWAGSAKEFWVAADTYERANGRVYSEVEFALPKELTHEQQKELAKDFARELTGKEDLPYTLAIHDEKGKNPHAHLVYSERGFDGYDRTSATHFKRANTKNPERGGAPKSVELRGSAWVVTVRKDWEVMANAELERAQVPARIDARSYKEQGIDLTPQVHLGVHANAMEKRGITTDRGDMYRERHQMRQLEHNLVQIAHYKQLAQRELQQQRAQVQAQAQAKARVEAQAKARVEAQAKARTEARYKLAKHVVEQAKKGLVLKVLGDGKRVVGQPLGEMADPRDSTKLLQVMSNAHDPKVYVVIDEDKGVQRSELWKVHTMVCVEGTAQGVRVSQDLRSPLQHKLDTQMGKELEVYTAQPGRTYRGCVQAGSYEFKGASYEVLKDSDKPNKYVMVPFSSGARDSSMWRAGREVEVCLDKETNLARVSVDQRNPTQRYVAREMANGAKLVGAESYEKNQGRVVEGYLPHPEHKKIYLLQDSKDPKRFVMYAEANGVSAHKNWKPGREVIASTGVGTSCNVIDVEQAKQQKQDREQKRQQDRDRGWDRDR